MISELLSFFSVPAVLLVSIVGLLALWLLRSRSRADMPPGPLNIPYLGYLGMFTGGNPSDTFLRLREKYGDVYMIHMGSAPIIVFRGYETLKDAFVHRGDVFSDRPSGFTKGKGIFSSSGEAWKEQRKFAIEVLHEFGFGKPMLENKIQEEIMEFLRVVEQNEGIQFDIQKSLNAAIANILMSFVFGKRYSTDDQEFVSCMDKIYENFRAMGTGAIIRFFPILRYLPGDLFKAKRSIKNGQFIKEIIQKYVAEHKTNFDGSESSDFIYAYLKEIRRRQKDNDTRSFDEDQLHFILGDFFFAGIESTATAIRWFFLYMIHHPDVQTKVQAEIDNVVGMGRFPSLADRSKLPYTEATIMELQRISSISPTAGMHACAEDVMFHGYRIPKGVTIFPNMDSVLKDKAIWGDPDTFRPERFMDGDGHLLKKEQNIPFFFGRRVCLGEAFAKMELFLFFASTLQRFTLHSTPGKPMPYLKGVYGITNSPEPFDMVVRGREIT